MEIKFESFTYNMLVEIFGKMDDKSEVYKFLLDFDGDNWVVPWVAGKRCAYLELCESEHTGITWESMAKL